jgi:hypothetical protein
MRQFIDTEAEFWKKELDLYSGPTFDRLFVAIAMRQRCIEIRYLNDKRMYIFKDGSFLVAAHKQSL